MSENTTEAKVDRRFIIDRQGKPFVLFAGLLDLAHQEGLDVVETSMIQVANEDNAETYIFKAIVHTKRGSFTGYADANPSNVSRQMLTVTCRLAETRAVARALRFATNVGMTAFEELGDTFTSDDDDAPKAQVSIKREAVVTAPQVRAIYAIGRDRHSMSESEVEEQCVALFGVRPAEISKREASDFITTLNGTGGVKATA